MCPFFIFAGKDSTHQKGYPDLNIIQTGTSKEIIETDFSNLQPINSPPKIAFPVKQSETTHIMTENHSSLCLNENKEIGNDTVQMVPSQAFNRTEMIRMRIHLLELIEELKLRRVGVQRYLRSDKLVFLMDIIHIFRY